MKPGVKRALKIVAAIVVVVIAAPFALMASAFIGRSSVDDGAEPDPAVHIVKDGIVSLAVLDVGGGRAALIDAGNDKEGKAVLAELARRKVAPDAVMAVLLTHGHQDHLAGCHLFVNAPVYVLGPDVALAEGRAGSSSPLGRLVGARPTGVKIARPLVDGETLELGNLMVRVFALPGHTAGSAAFLVNGVVFLGDSAGASKDGKLLAAPWAFSEDAAENRAGLKALGERLKPEAAEIKALVPAHNAVLKGLDPLLAFAD